MSMMVGTALLSLSIISSKHPQDPILADVRLPLCNGEDANITTHYKIMYKFALGFFYYTEHYITDTTGHCVS